MRTVQPAGLRGSLKWLQIAVNLRADLLDGPILAALNGATSVEWLSPLRHDDFAEYRDEDFLQRLGLHHLQAELSAFWPKSGPQWDALARTDGGHSILVEAKAHIPEMFSNGTQAGETTRPQIEAALQDVADTLGARPRAPWSTTFYQLANRLAHLHFLRKNGVDAKLVLVGFIGDESMRGPQSIGEWEAAYMVATHVMGLPKRHALSAHIFHVYPDVGHLQ